MRLLTSVTSSLRRFSATHAPLLLTLALLYAATAIGMTAGRGDWWMYQHDPQHTGRSAVNGPTMPGIKWKTAVGTSSSMSSPVIAANGMLYVGSDDHHLYAVNPNGILQWTFSTEDRINSTPAIAADGTIYIGSYDTKLYAINPDGTQKWVFTTTGAWNNSSPVVAADGTIYIGSSDNHLYAINPNGTQKWAFLANSGFFSSPALGADGTIYGVSWGNQNLYALNADGTKKWSAAISSSGRIYASPAVGTDGTVYVGSADHYLYAFTPSGTVKWKFLTGDQINSPPAIAADGTIYIGSYDTKLYAVNPNGTQKWAFITGGAVNNAAPLLGANGTLYFGSSNNQCYAITPNGTQQWAVSTASGFTSSPALGADGTLYAFCGDHNLYAITSTYTVTPTAGANGAIIPNTPQICLPNSNLTLCAKPSEGYTIDAWSVDNTVAQHGGDQFTLSSITANHTVSVTFRVPVTLAKAVNTAQISATGTVTYTLSYNVAAAVQVKNAILTDTLPANLSYIPGSATDGGSYSNGIVTWFLGTLNGGAFGLTHAMTFQARVNPLVPPGTQITNTASLSYVNSNNDSMSWRVISNAVVVTVSSVARGDWWMFHHDPQHTGRSAYNGPHSSNVKWICKVYADMGTNPVIGGDGTIYLSDIDLFAINPNGTQRWNYQPSYELGYSSPAIGTDGTLYTGGYQHLSAAAASGTGQWEFPISTWAHTSPVLGADGTIYVGDIEGGGNNFFALNPNGTQKWAKNTGMSIQGSPAIGQNGWIYTPTGPYYGAAGVTTANNGIYGCTPDGQGHWSPIGAGSLSSPAIGADGTVYMGSENNQVYAFSPNLTLKWTYHTGDVVRSTPAIGADGAIYVGSDDHKLYALNPNGSVRWTFATGDKIRSSPAIGADGTIYFGSLDQYFYALNPNGSLLWKLPTGTGVYSSPTIGADGTLYFQSNVNLYAIADPVLMLVKTVDKPLATPGDTVTYSLTYSLAVNGRLNGVTLTDPLPATLSYVPGSVNGGGTFSNGALSWSLGALSSGNYGITNTVTYQAIVNASVPLWTQIVNTASITSAEQLTTAASCVLSVMPSSNGRGDWWMFHHDAQRTGRSPFIGPAAATSKWTPFVTGDQIWSSPVVAADGTIYIGSNDSLLYAIRPDGTKQFGPRLSGQLRGAPAIAADGTIYAATTDAKLYAINLSGSQRWVYATGNAIIGSPVVGNDGTIYVGCDDHYLHAVNPDGSCKWMFATGDKIESSPAIGPDGTIYVSSFDKNLYAINANGTQKWSVCSNAAIDSSPAIGADGTIYVAIGAVSFMTRPFGPAFVNAFYPDGTLRWSYHISDSTKLSSPAIGADGFLYVGDAQKIYAMNAYGQLQWTYDTGDVIGSSPAIGADGTVYVGSCDHKLYALTASGCNASAKWTLLTGNAIKSSPAIGADGTVYVGSTDNKLYAVGVPAPALSLAATVTPSYVVAGSTVTYTLTVVNNGSKPATNVTLTDTLPSQISYLPGSAGNNGAFNTATKTLTWILGTVNAGVRIRVTFQATVNTTVPANPSIDDVAAVSCAEIPVPVTRHATFVLLSPVLSVTKSVAPAITPPGSQVTYTLSCTNTGNASGTNVTLVDILPQTLTYVDGSVTGGGAMNAGSLTWPLGSLNMGANVQMSFRARVNDSVSLHASISNNATIACAEIPVPVVSNTATFVADYTYTVTPSAGPYGSISPNTVQVIEAGGSVTFTAIGNTGYVVATWWLDNNPVQSGGGQFQLNNITANHAVRVTFDTAQDLRGDWWMYHHDRQHTGRSPFTGPATASLRWSVRLPSDNSIDCSPVIGADGTIYLGADDHNLYAVSANKSFLWQYRTSNAITASSSAAVGSDGKIYVGTAGGTFYALGHNGSLLWSYQSTVLGMTTPATIGLDGTVYVGDSDHKLQAFNPDGTTKWAHPFVASDRITAAPAIGTDGTIYCGTFDGKLYAINPNGTQKWVYQASRNDYGLYSAPTIGGDGTIYFGDTESGTWNGLLYALNPDGTQKWVFRCNAEIIESSAGIGADGTIYIGAGDGLHAINPDGTQKWRYYLAYGTDSSPAIDARGTIYFGSYDYNMYAVNPDGSLKWSFSAGGSIRTSPAISADGTLYFGCEDACIYAIGGGRVHTAQPGPPALPVAARYQPDLAIRNAGEKAYTGLGTLNTTGAGQTKNQTATTGTTVTYDLQLTNTGNTMDSFTLCCPLPALSGWTVQVIEQATGNDLTPAVIGAGNRSALLLPGATALYTVTITPAVDAVASVPCPLLFTATSAGDPTKQDAVKAVTTKPNTATK